MRPAVIGPVEEPLRPPQLFVEVNLLKPEAATVELGSAPATSQSPTNG